MAGRDAATAFREQQNALLEELEEDLGTEPFTNPKRLNKALRTARAKAHLISPVDSLDHIPQMHAVSLRVVCLDPFNPGEAYQPKWCGDGEIAPAQNGILKLWKNASGSDVFCKRVDDRLEPLCQTYTVAVNLRGIDGQDNITQKTKEVDLRDASPQISFMTKGQLTQARQSTGTLAETKARLRAIRSALALNQKYTIADLSKPFVIPVLVALVDDNDPAIRKLVALKALGMERMLYGAPDREALPEPAPPGVDTTTGEVIDTDVIPDDDPAEANSAAAGEFDPADFEEPEDDPDPVCDCPCGCSTTVNPAGAKMTVERRGHVRCAECYPGARFNAAKHKNLKTLGLTPDVTVAEAAKRAKRAS